MFYIVSKLLNFLTKPLFWLFFLLIICIIFKKKRKKILFITLTFLFIISNSFISSHASKLWEPKRQKINKVYDIGIVLGGISSYDKQTASHNFNKEADRLIEAEQLYRQGYIKKILLSGGNGLIFNDGYIEADAMKQHLVKNGIPENDILVENKSRNTKENALNSSLILKTKFPNGQFLLITSAKHIKRAKYCFDKFGINTTIFPTDCSPTYIQPRLDNLILPSVSAIETWEDLIHEWIGLLIYKIAF